MDKFLANPAGLIALVCIIGLVIGLNLICQVITVNPPTLPDGQIGQLGTCRGRRGCRDSESRPRRFESSYKMCVRADG